MRKRYTPVTDDQGRAACFYSMKFYELDEQSGLPKVLEKGSYFEVRKSVLGPDTLEVHYKKKRGWFAVSEGVGYISGVRNREVTQSEILFEALWALGEVEKARAAKPVAEPVKVKAEAEVKLPPPVSQRRALGKYPPKSLKEVLDGDQ